MEKSYFNIFIYITYDGYKNFFVTKIKVDNNIKKISKIPVDRYYLQYLLNKDGLDLHTLRNAEIYGNKSLFVIPIPRYELKDIVDKKEKQKNIKK